MRGCRNECWALLVEPKNTPQRRRLTQTHLMSWLPSPGTFLQCRWLSWWASYPLRILTLHRWLTYWVGYPSSGRELTEWAIDNSHSYIMYIHYTHYTAQSSWTELTAIHMHGYIHGTKFTCCADSIQLFVQELTCWAYSNPHGYMYCIYKAYIELTCWAYSNPHGYMYNCTYKA